MQYILYMQYIKSIRILEEKFGRKIEGIHESRKRKPFLNNYGTPRCQENTLVRRLKAAFIPD